MDDQKKIRAQWRQDEAERWRQDEAESRKAIVNMQNACHHLNANREWAICLQHNFSDRCTRGICMMCHLVIHPRHWASGGPNKVVVIPPHPLYPIVQSLDKRDDDLWVEGERYAKEIDRQIKMGLNEESLGIMWNMEKEHWTIMASIRERCMIETAKFIKPVDSK